MNNNNIYKHEKSNVKSNIIMGMVTDRDIMCVGAPQTSNTTSKFFNKLNQNNNKKNIIVVSIVIILIIILLAFVLVKIFSKTDKGESITLYDKAYDNLDFKEDESLQKLFCSQNMTDENSQVQATNIEIYYFRDDLLDTFIYHRDITLSDEYMDYYDTMYNAYVTTLKNDYAYDNVLTDLISDHNRLLETIITYNHNDGSNNKDINSLGNYEQIKQAEINKGYTCN